MKGVEDDRGQEFFLDHLDSSCFVLKGVDDQRENQSYGVERDNLEHDVLDRREAIW